VAQERFKLQLSKDIKFALGLFNKVHLQAWIMEN